MVSRLTLPLSLSPILFDEAAGDSLSSYLSERQRHKQDEDVAAAYTAATDTALWSHRCVTASEFQQHTRHFKKRLLQSTWR